MAVNNLSTDLFVLTINGRIISDWGETDPPYTDDPIDPRSVLRRGLGGNAVRLDRLNAGRSVVINLNPASPDSAFMQGLFNSNADITLSYQVIGTLEGAVGTDGVIVNDGQVGRGGMSITDDQFTIEFNKWTALKGGE
jgi:hypothetical protein